MYRRNVPLEMERRGFRLESTGGNCTAWVIDGWTGLRFILVKGDPIAPMMMRDSCEFWSIGTDHNEYLESRHASLEEFLKEFDEANGVCTCGRNDCPSQPSRFE